MCVCVSSKLVCYNAILGVLESPEDFSSSAELYEAVGGVILEAGGEGTQEKRVQELCDNLFRVIQG